MVSLTANCFYAYITSSRLTMFTISREAYFFYGGIPTPEASSDMPVSSKDEMQPEEFLERITRGFLFAKSAQQKQDARGDQPELRARLQCKYVQSGC